MPSMGSCREAFDLLPDEEKNEYHDEAKEWKLHKDEARTKLIEEIEVEQRQQQSFRDHGLKLGNMDTPISEDTARKVINETLGVRNDGKQHGASACWL